MAERRISRTETGGRYDDLTRIIERPGDTVILEGNDRDFVVIALDDYRDLVEEQRARRAAEAKQRYIALAAEIGDRNADLSEEEIAELANEFSAEFARDMVNEGRIRFRQP